MRVWWFRLTWHRHFMFSSCRIELFITYTPYLKYITRVLTVPKPPIRTTLLQSRVSWGQPGGESSESVDLAIHMGTRLNYQCDNRVTLDLGDWPVGQRYGELVGSLCQRSPNNPLFAANPVTVILGCVRPENQLNNWWYEEWAFTRPAYIWFLIISTFGSRFDLESVAPLKVSNSLLVRQLLGNWRILYLVVGSRRLRRNWTPIEEL